MELNESDLYQELFESEQRIVGDKIFEYVFKRDEYGVRRLISIDVLDGKEKERMIDGFKD